MSLEIYLPDPPLSSAIHMFWHWDNYSPSHARERILPAGLTELTFNLSEQSFRIYSPDDQSEDRKDTSIVVGMQSRFFVIDTSQPTTILSVLFKSGRGSGILGASALDLHNQIIPLSDLWGKKADDLYSKLMHTSQVRDRFKILEATLRERLVNQHELHYATNMALDIVSSNTALHPIAYLEKQVALSPTRFIQVFRDDIGVTPKVFSRLQRFQRSLNIIGFNSHLNWADIALRCGYYDQSHMINEFQKFSGITPSAYAPQSIVHNKNYPILNKV